MFAKVAMNSKVDKQRFLMKILENYSEDFYVSLLFIIGRSNCDVVKRVNHVSIIHFVLGIENRNSVNEPMKMTISFVSLEDSGIDYIFLECIENRLLVSFCKLIIKHF